MSSLPAPPSETRIQRRPISANEVEFLIPSPGHWGGWLFFAIVWNGMAWLGFIAFLSASILKQGPVAPVFIMLLFVAIGLVLTWTAVATRYTSHLLSLNTTRVRLQREIFGRVKIYELATAEIVSVQKKEFYQKNYRPVYGILIEGRKEKIRFGTVLTDSEKDWLCGEIWKFLQPHAPGLGELKIPE